MTRALTGHQPVPGSRILAVDGFRGERVVPNSEIIGPIDSSDEWIRQRTGIVTRRRANPETTILDMAVAAAEATLAKAGLAATQIDAVLLSTVTYFEQTPALAARVAHAIGATPAAAFDISAACAGYSYGIGLADSLVRSGQARHVLVIGVERMSDFIDPTDRSISFLLGDGAGAAVVGASDVPLIGPTVWGADGSMACHIDQTQSWLELRSGDALDTPAQVAAGTWPTLRQQGPSVFKWVISNVPDIARRAVSAAGLEISDIEVFVPHQANMRIIDQVAKMLGLGEDVAIGRDIADTGNTSAASIPLATERLLREGQAHSGQLALQIGFGAGMAYSAQVVALP
ncbi:beta-ketoacyl-ACP synthase III [Serinibacter salmoneus]|uniref:3-oxoacyl-[acyl-carrier-protein] synthase-3 n=1 Tax=Serinibacter salmoneus TaxID=556530 RepID=A0A2A9D0B5_9MICO|nr:beta-ketoacyl-ACP synthase III [Serinibacter salmoneus]PFG19831.1 3-oxoacyl-[acyl-carrier-protein] synthase-3 [Serinibacter salmoneus]